MIPSMTWCIPFSVRQSTFLFGRHALMMVTSVKYIVNRQLAEQWTWYSTYDKRLFRIKQLCHIFWPLSIFVVIVPRTCTLFYNRLTNCRLSSFVVDDCKFKKRYILKECEVITEKFKMWHWNERYEYWGMVSQLWHCNFERDVLYGWMKL